ncbi:hypothetical protein PR048_029912 [Dryococelus australis]|uniref:Uncharacterized protein n=1 Tax=Dryococelus australis TaxID=614101 RepID=A0ABQ9GBF1_9NEOP|nr:hypothetical protein PR048_029912 [Dryococelus australis]
MDFIMLCLVKMLKLCRQMQPNRTLYLFSSISCARSRKQCNSASCQTYSRMSKQLLHDNANLFIQLCMNDLNLNHIFLEYVNTDMTFDSFKNMCSCCWCGPCGFLVIAKDFPFLKG